MQESIILLHKARVGVGGPHCSCCNPRFGAIRGPRRGKTLRAIRRAVRRVRRQESLSLTNTIILECQLDIIEDMERMKYITDELDMWATYGEKELLEDLDLVDDKLAWFSAPLRGPGR